VEQYLLSGAVAVGVQGLALLVVRSWFKDVNHRLEKLNGFRERMLANHISKNDLAQHEARCADKHRDIFSRVHDLEMRAGGKT
jgi:hypothetical protein